MKSLMKVFVLVLSFQDLFSQNQVSNGGFEKTLENWENWGGQLSAKAYAGNYSVKIANETPKWSGVHQIIYLSNETDRVEVSGFLKTEGVKRGTKFYEQARIAIEFLDGNNAMVGNYLPVVTQQVGTTGWSMYKNNYNVPQGAKKCKIILALGNCIGTAWFDQIRVKYFEGEQIISSKTSAEGPKSKGLWYNFKVDPSHNGSHYVDWSGLLDKPAGKHGFLKTKGEELIFEDGTPIKFWGTNLVAGDCFISHQKVDSLVKRLSMMGCNMLRLHHMDADWARPNIFGNKPSTRQLSESSLEKLDYLIYKLKENGIYVFLDLLVHRDFKPEDGVENKPPDLGGKQVGYFSKQLIKLQKEFINQLLNHYNPYTKLAYKDEPAIACSEYINESTIFMHFGQDILTPAYRKELQDQFNKETGVKENMAIFDYDWSNEHTIKRIGTEGNVEKTIGFLNQKERSYYQSMYKYMREQGAMYPLAGSNFPPHILSYQRNNLVNDIILANEYWDHPQIWKINNDWNRIEYAPINNNSMIKSPEKSIVFSNAKHQWGGKPFIVTEYNMCYPNEYLLEGVPYVAAYGAMQGVDGMLQFNFNTEMPGVDADIRFSLSKMPEHLATWVVAAPLIHLGYIKEAKTIYEDHITEQQCNELPLYSDYLDKGVGTVYHGKVRKVLSKDSTDDTYPDIINNEEIESETKELKLNSKKGYFVINTPFVQGVTGHLDQNNEKLPFIKYETINNWSGVYIIAADKQPLTSSKKMYLVVVTPSRLKNETYNNARTALKQQGEVPVQSQVFEGIIALQSNQNMTLVPCFISGEKGEKMELKSIDGEVKIQMAKQKTYVFELTRK